MASNNIQALFHIFLLIIAISCAPKAANAIVYETVGGATVNGELACTRTGDPPPFGAFQLVVGATVIVSCNRTTNLTARTTTNAYGKFNVTLTPLNNVNLNLTVNTSFGFLLPDCFATVQLPVTGCSLLPPRGVLRAPIFSLGVVLDNALGLVLFFLTGSFSFSK